jgi:hypothetical protein
VVAQMTKRVVVPALVGTRFARFGRRSWGDLDSFGESVKTQLGARR